MVYGELAAPDNTLSHTLKLGMVFGEGNADSTFETQVAYTFNYDDSYSSTLTDQFNVYVNRLPYATAVGTAFTFSTFDPYCSRCTTYFDDYFPWIVDDYLEILEENTALWWTEDDTTDVL